MSNLALVNEWIQKSYQRRNDGLPYMDLLECAEQLRTDQQNTEETYENLGIEVVENLPVIL